MQTMTQNNLTGEWSGNKPVPQIGDIVNVNFNSFGRGSVVGFKIVDGYIGAWVKLDKQPEWHLKQNGCQPIILAFGIELN